MRQVFWLLWLAVILCAVGTGAFFAFQEERATSVYAWLILGAPTIVFAAIGMVRAHRHGELKAWLRPAWGDFSLGFGGAAICFGGAIGGAKLLLGRDTPRGVWLQSLYLHIGDPKTLQANVAVVFLIIVVLAFAEEVLWRGFVTTLVAERFGSRTAWVWSAGLYALAHLPTLWSLRRGDDLDPILPLAALACGLVWGAMTRYSGRIIPAFLSHALFDWCVVMMFPLWSLSGS